MSNLLFDGLRWLLVSAMCLAIAEKLTTLHAGSAKWHPVMLANSWRREQAVRLMSLSVALDALVLLMLLLWPRAGGAGMVLLTLAYSAIALPNSKSHDTCRCFLAMFKVRTPVGFGVRNLLFVSAGFVVALAPSRFVLWGPVSGLGLALAVTASVAAVDRLVDRRRSVRKEASTTRSDAMLDPISR
jgi:hypothetical protein